MVDSAKLQEIAREFPIAKNIFYILSKRERNRPSMDLRRLRDDLIEIKGVYAPWNDIISVFKRFQKLGVGTLTHPDGPTDRWRFKWKENLIEVGSLGLAGAPKVSKVDKSIEVAGGSTIVVAFPFRDGYLNLKLPADISDKEADTLAAAIRSFPKSLRT